ncbi:MAG: hypothetical protein Q9226_009423, partial [Calogaya cf. arnoldii]
MTSQERKKAYLGKALFPPFALHQQIAVSMVLEDRNTFEEALKNAGTYLSTFKLIGTAMATFGIGTDHSTVSSSINALLKSVTSFNGRIQAMAKLIEGFDLAYRRGSMDPAIWADMQAWSKSINKEALQTLEFVDPDDGTCLAKLALKEPDMISLSDLIPLAKKFEARTAFLTALATEIFTAGQTGESLDDCERKSILDQLVNVLAPKFRIGYKTSAKPGEEANGIPAVCLADAEDVD